MEFAGLGVHKVESFARETSHWLVTVVLGRDCFVQSVALDAKPCVGAAIEDRTILSRCASIGCTPGVASIKLQAWKETSRSGKN
jgi:hypothetical protein